jgi:hypothetical protein
VRAIDQRKGFPARITAVARHLIEPARKVYMVDMEGPIWEVDVRTLEATRLFVTPVPGWHAKGAYTAQGRLIVANNGELRTADLDKLDWESPERTWSKGPEDAGVLAEYDGKAWTIVARRPHTEVTGPGGLTGESAPDAPVWSVGWDKRSVLLQVRSGGPPAGEGGPLKETPIEPGVPTDPFLMTGFGRKSSRSRTIATGPSGSRSKWTSSQLTRGTSTRRSTYQPEKQSFTDSPAASPRTGCD